jgi:hypothetical protein
VTTVWKRQQLGEELAADTAPGKRRLNWVWYVGVREADLHCILIDRDGRQRHASLPFGGTLDLAIRDLRDLARREVHPMLAALSAATPQPFLQTIVDVAPTRTVFPAGACSATRP